MKKIIEFIIDQRLESLDDYPSLAQPLSNEFNIELKTAEKIIDDIIGWETSSTTIDSLEEVFLKRFPDVVTN